MVKCPLCPATEVKRYRDNGRLRDHLKSGHHYSSERARAYLLEPKPRLDVEPGFWQDWDRMWNRFCSGRPIPASRCEYIFLQPQSLIDYNTSLIQSWSDRELDVMGSIGKIYTAVRKNENSGNFNRNFYHRAVHAVGEVMEVIPQRGTLIFMVNVSICSNLAIT